MQTIWALILPLVYSKHTQWWRETTADFISAYIFSLHSAPLSIWRRDKQLSGRLHWRPSVIANAEETASGTVIPHFPIHGWQLHFPSPISQAWPRSHAPMATCIVGSMAKSWAGKCWEADLTSISDAQVGGKQECSFRKERGGDR